MDYSLMRTEFSKIHVKIRYRFALCIEESDAHIAESGAVDYGAAKNVTTFAEGKAG